MKLSEKIINVKSSIFLNQTNPALLFLNFEILKSKKIFKYLKKKIVFTSFINSFRNKKLFPNFLFLIDKIQLKTFFQKIKQTYTGPACVTFILVLSFLSFKKKTAFCFLFEKVIETLVNTGTQVAAVSTYLLYKDVTAASLNFLTTHGDKLMTLLACAAIADIGYNSKLIAATCYVKAVDAGLGQSSYVNWFKTFLGTENVRQYCATTPYVPIMSLLLDKEQIAPKKFQPTEIVQNPVPENVESGSTPFTSLELKPTTPPLSANTSETRVIVQKTPVYVMDYSQDVPRAEYRRKDIEILQKTDKDLQEIRDLAFDLSINLTHSRVNWVSLDLKKLFMPIKRHFDESFDQQKFEEFSRYSEKGPIVSVLKNLEFIYKTGEEVKMVFSQSLYLLEDDVPYRKITQKTTSTLSYNIFMEKYGGQIPFMDKILSDGYRFSIVDKNASLFNSSEFRVTVFCPRGKVRVPAPDACLPRDDYENLRAREDRFTFIHSIEYQEYGPILSRAADQPILDILDLLQNRLLRHGDLCGQAFNNQQTVVESGTQTETDAVYRFLKKKKLPEDVIQNYIPGKASIYSFLTNNDLIACLGVTSAILDFSLNNTLDNIEISALNQTLSSIVPENSVSSVSPLNPLALQINASCDVSAAPQLVDRPSLQPINENAETPKFSGPSSSWSWSTCFLLGGALIVCGAYTLGFLDFNWLSSPKSVTVGEVSLAKDIFDIKRR